MKREPENCADLKRMMETSGGWFDGTIIYKNLRKDGEPYETGQKVSESIHVRVVAGCVDVFCCEGIVGEVKGPSRCSIETRELWRKHMSFVEFRESEWWNPAMEKFAGGDCDASEIYARNMPDGMLEEWAGIEAHVEKHYRDWLGNSKMARGYHDVKIYLEVSGELEIKLGKRSLCMEVEEIFDLVDKAREFEAAGIKIEDGELRVKVKRDDE
jgi:hypothetical protein